MGLRNKMLKMNHTLKNLFSIFLTLKYMKQHTNTFSSSLTKSLFFLAIVLIMWGLQVTPARAAITFVASSTAVSNTNPYTLSFSGMSLQQGDIVIILTGYVSTGNGDPGVNTAGYTDLNDLYANDTRDANLATLWKIMGVTPDSSVECRASTVSTNGSVCIAYAWRGVDQSTPMDVASTSATAIDSAIPDSPSITPVTAGALVVALGLGTGVSVDTDVTAPSGYSNKVSTTTDPGNAVIAGVASKAWSGSGAEDPAAWTDWTTSTGDSWAAVTLALRPASDPSTVTTRKLHLFEGFRIILMEDGRIILHQQ